MLLDFLSEERLDYASERLTNEGKIILSPFFSVPPKSLILSQPEAVRAGETLQLACTAKDSQPKTTLMWYRGDNPIPDGAGKTLASAYPSFGKQ